LNVNPRTIRWAVPILALCASAAIGRAQQAAPPIAFTVSMDPPAAHIYHVTMKVEGLTGDAQDFKMPVWTPGYYGLADYAKNVRELKAQDGQGKELKWEKTGANVWHIQVAPVMTLTYDVLATSTFVANSYLGEDHATLGPTSVLLHVAGQINRPVTVDIKPNPNWKNIATGLDTVAKDKPNTFKAPDFDVLYDSPILMGNLDVFPTFEIKGVPHNFIALNAGTNFDRDVFIRDLQATVEQGIAVIGDIPYTHYTFLGTGGGQGGIEHLNSTTLGFRGSPNLNNLAGRLQTLRFFAHEYFHNYNVKRIRPIVLGPFDYDKANLTTMLWVSEGFTVYYEDLMVARAGLMTQAETLAEFTKNMAAYENKTGHLFQSATQASLDSWKQGSGIARGGQGVVKVISYYDKGPVLGLLLDFKIRHETQNKKSLDTVMQTLYKEYYQNKKRGWTDEEFQAACESVAGVPLQELFDYASTTKDVDYPKYLAYAGLELEPFKELSQPDFRGVVEDVNGKLTLTAMEGNSAAHRAGLEVKDEIKSLDGAGVDARGFAQAIAAKKPGDKIKLAITRAGADREIEMALDPKLERSFRMRAIANPDALQAEILKDWLKKKPL
jgi:predicted metalloprotease with PDZ domain